MKKSLLALAVLGAFAGAASAQSSVTLYGLVDMGVMRTSSGTSVAANDGVGNAGQWNLKQGAASRLGVRGTEDLGGGLKANFQIEHRFNPDTGAQSNANAFWHGRSYVSLSSNVGTVYLGREYVPAFWVASSGDPWGWDNLGQLGQNYTFASYGSADNTGTNGSIRNSNTVGLKTANYGGFSAELAVSGGEGVRGRGVGFNAQYAAGPLYVGLGYDTTDAPSAKADPRLVVVTAKYAFGPVTPSLTYAQNRKADSTKTKSIALGLAAKVGPSGEVRFGVGRLDPEGSNNNSTKVALGYMHGLSKRTSVYADVSTAKTDNLTRSKAVGVGIKHTF
jgi:predicted porin